MARGGKISSDRPGSVGSSGDVSVGIAVEGRGKKKKKKKLFKRTLPRGGTQGYSSSYSDPLTKKKVVDIGSSI